MEIRRYYFADKIIEMSINLEDNKLSTNNIVDIENAGITTRGRIILNKACKAKAYPILKKILQKSHLGNNDPIEIVFHPKIINQAICKDICLKLINELIKKEKNKIKELRLKFLNQKDFNLCIGIIESILLNICSKTFRNPYPAADIIIRYGNGVVLVYRKNPPSGWAIPGGFINYGESAEHAAIREAREETGLTIKNLKLFGVFSSPDRDPRFHTISIVFTGHGKGKLKAGDDASRVKVFDELKLPEKIVFDHKKILKQFFKAQKKNMKL